MKTVPALLIPAIILTIHLDGYAQHCPTSWSFKEKNQHGISELSIGIGASHYFGDLNAINMTNMPIIGELHKEQINPVLSLDYRYYFSHISNLRIGFLYTRINGSDQHNELEENFSATWFRKYRNLTFRSNVLELSASVELNLLGFEPGNFKRMVSPYVVAGAGLIYFNPKAPYKEELYSHQPSEKKISMDKLDYAGSEWIELQPLGTEGQGLPGYPDKYSLIQPVFISGAGFKFNVSSSWTLVFEVSHHFTLTDYLDDVSTVYPNTQIFFRYYEPEDAQLISRLSTRSTEVDPQGEYSFITAEGQQRGNPNRRDSYLVCFFSVGYVFSKNK